MPRPRMTQEEYIKRANELHNYAYLYDKTVYAGMEHNIVVVCPVHGDFEVLASNHTKVLKRKPTLSPCGCPRCGRDKVISRNKAGVLPWSEFVSKANDTHNNRYTYIQDGYAGINRSVTICCPTHGLFVQNGLNHVRGTGCPKCKNSRGQTMVAKALTRLNVAYIPEHTFDDCRGDTMALRFDFYIPSHNTIIEYDGEQHFKPVRFHTKMSEEMARQLLTETQRRDSIKDEYAARNGIRMVRIPYTEQQNITSIIKSLF